MKILITGATGLIGVELVKEFFLKGYQIVVLTRDVVKAKKKLPYPIEFYLWREGLPPKVALKNITGVVNLMGENIAAKRWSKNQKKKIYDSRVKNTENLIQALKQQKLDFFISASAIGYYPANSGKKLLENSAQGQGFLAEVCSAWEKIALQAKAKRVIIFRLGLVLSSQGGALAKLIPIFRLGLGGTIGLGKRQVNWIHLKDVTHFLCLAVAQKKYQGVYNLVAPNHVTNAEFTKALSNAVGIVALFPIAPVFLKLLFGEMACLILDDQQVIPKKLLEFQHLFLFPDIQKALFNEIFQTFHKTSD